MPHTAVSRDVAVVDLGSNSVRLVVYRVEGRALWSVFNEKVLAGLGRGVAQSGRLNPDGVAAATAALRRFRAVLDAVEPAVVLTAATAAVREAEDGPAFVERVRQETGLTIRVLSGEEEARYAALGVLAGAPEAAGMVGDLGGSSLELTPVGGGRPSPGVTLALGPFSLGAPEPIDAERLRATIARRLGRVKQRPGGKVFHAVGGAWRNLALLQMRMSGYPLRIVHGYRLSAREALDAARFIARQSRTSLERIEGVSKKRLETLPYAALVLEGVVETFGFEHVEVSAYGVREGLLLETMAPEHRGLDPLVEGCAVLGGRQGLAPGLGPALAGWLAPAFATLAPVFTAERDAVLVAAASRLADVGAQLHPDHRAELVFDQVLRTPVTGQTHGERAFLAAALFARYDGQGAPPDPVVIDRLLQPEQLTRARALGAALRLGCDLSGRSPGLLRHAQLSFPRGDVVLAVDPDVADLLRGEQAKKRLNALAQLLDREPISRAR